jgi:hypothetical protein
LFINLFNVLVVVFVSRVNIVSVNPS